MSGVEEVDEQTGSQVHPQVVVVDDNELLLAAMKRWLRRELGWASECFDSPIEALEYLRDHAVDILIVDLVMPELNGIDFLSEVQLIHDDAVQILMTGHDFYDSVIDAINRLNLYFFVEKPWEPQKMLLVLHNAWEKKRLAANLARLGGEAKETFQKLRLAQKDLLRQKNQAVMGELIQGVCHNLNSPLGVVVGHLDLLKLHLDSNEGPTIPREQVESSIQKIDEATNRIRQIVDNLMVKSRMEGETLRQRIAIDKGVRQEMDFLHADAFLKHNVSYSLDSEENLPELVLNYADFSQIFGNLVRNALDAMRDVSQPRLEVSTRYDREQDAILLEVHDNGPGVEDDLKESIFQPFFTTKKPVEVDQGSDEAPRGTGLGLHSVVQLLRPYKGEIHVEDSPLGGACFKVLLPLHRDENVSPEEST